MMVREEFSWVDVDGIVYPFEPQGILLKWGPAGFQAGPKRVSRRALAGQPGALLDAVEDDVRAFAVPCLIESVFGEAGFYGTIEEWAYRMDPTRGPGKLLCSVPGLSARTMDCLYLGGFDFAETEEARTDATIETVLEFESAGEPYWVDIFPQRLAWRTGGDPPEWFGRDWFGGLWFGSDDVIGTQTVTVNSHKPTPPVWEIEGPATTITATHTETGDQWEWDGTEYGANLLAGETLTIDIGAGTVVHEAASVQTNAFAGLTKWNLWSLAPGAANTIDVVVAGSSSETVVRLEWLNRHNGRRR